MINQKAHDRLIKSRSKLMKGHVGMASMLLHLDLIEVSFSQCGTMATDGKRIIYNPDFVLEVEEDELRSVLIHEALHVVYEHPLRRGKRHPKVWNISCDYAINGLLIYDLGMELPEGGLWSREYQGKSSEAIYSELMKSEESLQEAIDSMGEGNEGNSETEGGDDEQSNTGKYFAPSDVKTGEQVGEIDLDSIPMPTGEVWDAQDEGKPLSDSAITELKGEIQRAVSLADKLEKAMSTEGTSSMSNRIDQLKDVKVNWKDELNDFLQSSVANENSWARLNRRHSWRGINLPSKAKSPQGGELAVAIDMSGSVSQYELKNEQGEWWDIYELDQGDELVLRARGGGGTRFDPPFNLFNDYSDDVEDVQAFIYFTDGWGDVSADVEPSIPVIWCVTEESYYAERLPFGEVIYVDTSTLY